jgi:hypothetical protein
MAKKSLLQIRFIQSAPKLGIGIADKKTVVLVPGEDSYPPESILQSNSQMLTAAVETLFDLMWETAKEPSWS